MTYQQVRDVVSVIRRAHQQMRDVLRASRADDPRSELMLEALREEEQELQRTLARAGKDGADGLLNTWLQYVPSEEVFRTLNGIKFSPDMSPDDVIAKKTEFDQALMELLRQLADETSIPRVQEFFGDLYRNMESRTSQQSWAMQFQSDVDPRPRR